MTLSIAGVSTLDAASGCFPASIWIECYSWVCAFFQLLPIDTPLEQLLLYVLVVCP